MYGFVNSQIYDRLIVRLKVIKYKENLFYYLSFNPDLSFQATYFSDLIFYIAYL